MVANYLTHPDDVKVLVAGIRVIQRLANTTVMQTQYGMTVDYEEYGDCAKRFGFVTPFNRFSSPNQLNYRYDTDAFWSCAVKYYTGPENHQACSCRMGPKSDPMAVVDNKLKIHDLSNVRIMDASAMPVLVSGNTHATIVMMAERGVDWIKEEWLKPDLDGRFGEEVPQKAPGIQAPVD